MDKILKELLDSVSGGNAEDRKKALAALDAGCGGDDARWNAGFRVYKEAVETALTKMAQPSGGGRVKKVISAAEQKAKGAVEKVESVLPPADNADKKEK